MQFDEDREVALLCDLCLERLKNGEQPACSMVCPTRCILWGDLKTIHNQTEQGLTQRAVMNRSTLRG